MLAFSNRSCFHKQLPVVIDVGNSVVRKRKLNATQFDELRSEFTTDQIGQIALAIALGKCLFMKMSNRECIQYLTDCLVHNRPTMFRQFQYSPAREPLTALIEKMFYDH